MKEFYYYHRDQLKRPVRTNCIITVDDGSVYARGVAVCSDKDSPCKKIGREISKGRAFKALLGKRSKMNTFGHTRYEYMPKLYPIEQRFIDRLHRHDAS